MQRKIISTDEGPVDQTWDPTLHVIFATRTGIIKKTNLSDFDNVRRGGIIAITIEEGDQLIEAELTNGSNSVVLVTHDGMSLRFHEEQARPMGRAAVGNWGIRPEEGDYLVAMVVVQPEADPAGGRRERRGQNAPRSTITASNRAAVRASSR